MMRSMKKKFLFACAAASIAALPLSAQDSKAGISRAIRNCRQGQAEEWVAIAPSDLLVMDLAAT